MRRFLLLFLFVNVITTCIKGNDNFRFHKVEFKEGIPQVTILSIFQDSRGLIWFSTYDGLCKYDGNDLVAFYPKNNDNTTISDGTIYSIAEGHDDKMYFATNGGGLNVYDFNTKLFEFYKHDSTPNSILDNSVNNVVCASDSSVWIATYSGVSRFFPQTGKFDSYSMNDSSLYGYPNATAFCVHEDLNKTIWVGTYQEGLLKYNENANSFSQYKIKIKNVDIYESNVINQICSFNDTLLVVATKTGGYYFNTISEEFLAINNYAKEISSIMVDSKKNIWMTSGEEGLFIKDSLGNIIRIKHDSQNPYSIPDNKTSYIYEDNDGLIWMGALVKGLYYYNPAIQQFEHYFHRSNSNSILGNEIYGLAEDPDHKLWITTISGVSILDRKTGKFTNFVENGTRRSISSNVVWDAFYDNDGFMWLALSNGIDRYDYKTGRFKHFKREVGNNISIADNEVFSLVKDKNGDIWAGTNNGLSRYNKKTKVWNSYFSSKSDTNSLSNNIIWYVYSDSKGRLWIGTNKGLNQYNFNADNFTRCQLADSVQEQLASSEINYIKEDSEGIIWISTTKGILRWNISNEEITKFTMDNGLPNDVIYGIQEHGNFLWFTSNKGLTKFNKKTFETVNFDVRDGIQSSEFNIPSIKLHDGYLAFGGMNGLTVFNPEEIVAPEKEMTIYFSNLMLNGEEVRPNQERFGRIPLKKSMFTTDTLEISYHEKLISIDITALEYYRNSKISYRYRVLPKTKRWIELKGTNNVTFANLQPGKYILEIQSTNGQGKWLDNTKKLTIIIKPPFYKRVWFYVLLALLIILYLRRKTYRIRTANARLENAVRERTEQISAQKEELEIQRDRIAEQKTKIEHFADDLEIKVERKTKQYKEAKERAEESDRLKSAFLANMSHEIRTPLNAIIGFSDLLVSIDVSEKERKKYASYIRNNGDALLNLLNDILDASIIESGKLQLVNKVFSIVDVMENTRMSFIHSQLLKEKPEIVFDVKPCRYPHAKLKTDLFRLCQVLNNLVGNAIKYTHVGHVVVDMEITDSTAIFEVRDTGVGIKKSEQSKIFNRFHKDEKNNKKSYRGGGLGLPISKSLVELMGGEIWVESEFNVGSSFFFSIPGVIK